jgi:DNA-binding response OmpR family regulator
MRPKIMLVHGEPGNRAAVKSLLDRAGFRVVEIDAARLRALLRRDPEPTRPAVRASALRLDLAGRIARAGGKGLALTRKEFDLLGALVERRGRVLERAFLLDTVWGDAAERDAHTLEVHICSLRRKLGPSLARRIVTVPGLGYRFEKEARSA